MTREELAGTNSIHNFAFTSGCFDLLHPGHVFYLANACQFGKRLVVGVNSDASVQLNKGISRPIMPELGRLKMVAALECVDYVFLFNEKDNYTNIDLLRPSYYVKGGDYTVDQLSSSKTGQLVQSYGGQIKVLEFAPGYSTSSIIRKCQSLPICIEKNVYLDKAVFIDRDGTLIKSVDFLSEPGRVELLPGVVEGLKLLKAAGFGLFQVTNQAGIGMGYLTREEFYAVDRELRYQLIHAGISLDRVFYCPHHIKIKCECRKPNPKLALMAAEEFGLDLSKCWMMGDRDVDQGFAENAGMKFVMVNEEQGDFLEKAKEICSQSS